MNDSINDKSKNPDNRYKRSEGRLKNYAAAPNHSGRQNSVRPSSARLRAERAKARMRRKRRRLIFTAITTVVLIAAVVGTVFVIGRLISALTDRNHNLGNETGISETGEKSPETLPPETDSVQAEPLTGPAAYGITFISDLSSYEEYMDPADRDGYLLIANKTTSLDESYMPDDLTELADTRADGRTVQKLRYNAAKAFEAMFIEMRACGYTDVSITSGYRSYSYQAKLFEDYTNKELANHPGWTLEQAEEMAATYSARAGTSEHQTGLCCDMHNLSSADKAFANEPVYTWLCDNSWKFGIILRYPEDKTDITGYDFEPWHYRYVGRYHASKIHESGLCLEEYISQLNISVPEK